MSSPRTFGDLLVMRGPHGSVSNTCQFCKKWGRHVESGELWKYSIRHYICRPCIGARATTILPSVKRHEKIEARFAELRSPAPPISGEAFSGRIVKAILPLFAIAIMLHMGQAIAAPPLFTPPSCSSERQCAGMWAAARDWVASSCEMKIRTMTDSYIETFTSEYGSYCRVWRDPLPAGGFIFRASVGYSGLFSGKHLAQMAASLQAALKAASDAFQ